MDRLAVIKRFSCLFIPLARKCGSRSLENLLKLSNLALASCTFGTYIPPSFIIEIMRRPKGIKTKKSVSKRFKITGTGKVMRSHAGKRHLLQGKKPKRRRALGSSSVVDPTDEYRIKQNLPFSH